MAGILTLIVRLRTQAVGRARGHADPEPVRELPGRIGGRDEGTVAADIPGADLDRIRCTQRGEGRAEPRHRGRIVARIGVEIGEVPVAVPPREHGDGRRVPGHRTHADAAGGGAGVSHAEAFGALTAADREGTRRGGSSRQERSKRDRGDCGVTNKALHRITQPRWVQLP